jgi:hypothetical protein
VTSVRVNERLSLLVDEFKVSQDRNGMKHIALKCKATRRNSKSSMNSNLRSEGGTVEAMVESITASALLIS